MNDRPGGPPPAATWPPPAPLGDAARPGRYRQAEQAPPPPERVSDVVVRRFEHVYEVDPRLMGAHFAQQAMPAWDTRRIVAARWDHLDDIHAQFADAVVLAGEGPETGGDESDNRGGS